MDKPRGCFECKYCKEQYRFASRNAFFCSHPDQDYIKAYCNLHRMVKMPGFISYSEPTKRRQRYCPLKRGGEGA